MTDPNQDIREVLARFNSDTRKSEFDDHEVLTTAQVILAMKMYAGEQLIQASRNKTSKTEIQWSYGSVGAVVGLFMWLIFNFVTQPGEWMFTNMSTGQAMIAFGVLTIVAPLTGALIGVLLALHLWVDDQLTKKVSR